MAKTIQADATLDLVDVIDMEPVVGEYVGCTHPMEEMEVFGHTIKAWHYGHAARLVVSRRWDHRCEDCNHVIRYAHIVQDSDGAYHCYGGDCLHNHTLGTKGAYKFKLSEQISQAKSGEWCATFDVPAVYWDMSKDQRPSYARIWKGQAYNRRQQPKWRLSVWAKTREECLANCVDLSDRLNCRLV